jgi:hypothetical protein
MNIYRYEGEDDPIYNPFLNYELKETFNKLQLNRNPVNYDETTNLWDTNSIYYLLDKPYTKIYELLDYVKPSGNEILFDNLNYIVEIVDFIEVGFQNVDKVIDMTTVFGIQDVSNDIDEIFERYLVFVNDLIEYCKRDDAKNLYEIYRNAKETDPNRIVKIVYGKDYKELSSEENVI